MVEPTTKTTYSTKYSTPGYEKEHTELAAAGYPHARHNEKALKKSGGVLARAKTYLAERKARKERTVLDKHLPKLKAAGLEEQHNQLVAAGFTKPKKNLRVLKKTGGDVEKAKVQLGKKKSQLFKEWITGAGYEEKHNQLVAAGYTRPNKNYKALQKAEGNYDKARQLLDEKRIKKREVIYTAPSDFDVKHKSLISAGHTNRYKNIKALRKADGDIEKAQTRLNEKREKYLDAIRAASYDEQHKELVAAGYLKPRRNLKYLRKNQGSVEKVKQELAERKARKEAFKIECKALGYEDKHNALAGYGFRKRRRNYKALQKAGGDIEQAKIALLERQRNRPVKDKFTYGY